MQTDPLKTKDGLAEKKAGLEYDELLRENHQLRGDLRTIARRLNHDLQTPLGVVVGTGEALKEMLAQTDPAVISLADLSLNSGKEVSRLIKRACFVLKATADPVPPQPVAMGDAVSAAWHGLESQILAKGAVISQPADWPEVIGVAAWLEIVWWNLLANALQHSGPNPRVELGWRGENGGVRFWVSDHGPGVPAARRDKLFQPFQTMHERDSARGMGLSFVRRLLDLQGGTCGYETGPGGGSCFYFSLPVPSR